MAFLGEPQAKGVDLYLHVQGLDTSTPAGRVMFQMLGVFSEFERLIIQERVRPAWRGPGSGHLGGASRPRHRSLKRPLDERSISRGSCIGLPRIENCSHQTASLRL